MALVSFKRGTKPADLSSLNADTIYFFTDTKEIYVGQQPYGGDLTDLIARVTASEADILEAQNDIDAIETRLDDLETFQGTAEGQYNDLKDAIDEAKTAADAKISNVTAADGSVVVATGTTSTDRTVKVAISEADDDGDNLLELKSDGLYVGIENIPDTAFTDYTVTLDTAAEPTTGYAKTYEIKQGATGKATLVGKIDIPKDLVVSSGTVETDADDEHEGAWIKLVLNNDDVIWIAASDLVDTVTANNAEGAAITVTVTDGTKISATLENGKVVEAHLESTLKDKIAHGEAAYTALTWGTL